MFEDNEPTLEELEQSIQVVENKEKDYQKIFRQGVSSENESQKYAEILLPLYLAEHSKMSASSYSDFSYRELEFRIIRAIVRQYTVLKEYRLSSFYLGYAYQLIHKLNLSADELTKERNKIDSELQLQQMLFVYHIFFSPNEPFANRQLNAWCSFGRETAPYFLAPYQLLQSSFSQLSLPNTRTLEEFIQKASHLSFGAKAKDDVVAIQLSRYQEHRNKLEKARSIAITVLEYSSVEVVQVTWSAAIKECINQLCEEVKQELGEPYGYRFCLLSLGSLSRDEACLRSDIEFALLCEEIEGHAIDAQSRDNIQKYFQAFVGLLELKVIALGETNELFFSFGNGAIKNFDSLGRIKQKAVRGLQFDEAGNYALSQEKNLFDFLTTSSASSSHDRLLRIMQVPASVTPKIKCNLLGDKAELFSRLGLHESHPYLLIDAEHLYGDESLTEMFIQQRKEVLQETHIENHWSYQQFLGYVLGLPGSIEFPKVIDGAHGKALHIKQHLQFVQWIVKSLALYYGIEARHSVARVHALVNNTILHPYIGNLLTQVIQILFQARLKAHHHYGTENDILYLSEQADENLFSLRQFPAGIRILKEFPTIYRYLNTLLINWQANVKRRVLSDAQAEHDLEQNQNEVPYEVDIVFAAHETLLEPLILSPREQAAMQPLLQLPEEDVYLSRETTTNVTYEILVSRRNVRAMQLLLAVINETEAEHPIQLSFEAQQAFHRMLAYLGMIFKFYFKLPSMSITDCFMEAMQRKHLSPELGQWLLNTLGWLRELQTRQQGFSEEAQQRWLQISASLRILAQALKLHIDVCTQNPAKVFQLDTLIADYINQSLVKASNAEDYANWFIDVTRFLLYTQAPIAAHRHFYNKLPRDQRSFCLEQAKSALDKREPWWNRGALFWEQLWDAPDEAGNRPSYEFKQQRWQTQLATLLCEEADIIEQKTKVYIHSLTVANYALSPEMTSALIEQKWIDVHGAFTKKASHPIAKHLPGNHLVIPWPLPDGEKIRTILSRTGQDEKTISNDILKEVQTTAQFYLKVYPEYPLVELFLHELGRRLGYFTPRFVDVWLWQSSKSDYPILVSEAVPGQTLQQVLDTQQRLEFNLQAFNESVTLNALVRLEDNKPDNVVIRNTDYGQQLVLVDADRWFVPAFKSNQLHAKDITFCLDDMNLKIDSVWREEFLSLNAEALLKAWVAFLKAQGTVCQVIFKTRMEEYFNDYTFSKRKSEEKTLLLPPLKLAVVTELFENIQRLQLAIAQHPQLKLFQLVSCIGSRLANHYGRAHQEKQSVLERFKFVAGHAYLSGKGGREYFPTKINFKTHQEDQWQSLMLIKDKPKNIRTSWERDIGLAEKELKGISESPEQLERVKQQLIKDSSLQSFTQLSRRGKEKVLDTLNWSTLSTKIQQTLLDDIKTELSWEHISFHHLSLLTDDDVVQIFKKSPNVKTLTLVDCPEITGATLTSHIASQKDFPLKAIKFKNLPQLIDWGHLSGFLTFELCLTLPNLGTLEISNCGNISSIHIQAKLLKVLSLSNMPKLTVCQSQSQQLGHLKIANTNAMSPMHWNRIADNGAYVYTLHTAAVSTARPETRPYADLVQKLPFLLSVPWHKYDGNIATSEIDKLFESSRPLFPMAAMLSANEKQRAIEAILTYLNAVQTLRQTLAAALLERLKKDKEIDVCQAAAGALCNLGHAAPGVVDGLLAALKDDNKWVILAAAGVLIKLGHVVPEAIEVFLAALKDDEWVRIAAAEALGNLGHAAPGVVNSLLVALKDDNWRVREAAADALMKLGYAAPGVVDGLLAALKDDSEYVRVAAAGALVKLGHAAPVVVDSLLAALKDHNEYVREAAAGALGNLGHAALGVVDNLLAALKDDHLFVRLATAYALGNLGHAAPSVVDGLLAALKDKYSGVRHAAAEALGNLGHAAPGVVDGLLAALKDDNYYVRQAAASALMKLGHAVSDATEVLLAALKDKDSDVRHAAAEALGNLGHAAPGVVDGLLAALKDDNYYVRQAAASALMKLGHAVSDATEVLLAALKDDKWVRQDTANTLGNLGHAAPGVVDGLLAALKDDSKYVRQAAASALMKLGHAVLDATEVLLAALKDDSKYYVRIAAAEALGNLGHAAPGVVDGLLAALKDDSKYVRIAAAEALGNLGHATPGVVNGLLVALKDKDSDVRQAAAESLGNLASNSFKHHFTEFNAAIQTLSKEANTRLEQEAASTVEITFVANRFGMFAQQTTNERAFNSLSINEFSRGIDISLNEAPGLEELTNASIETSDFEPTTMRKIK